MYTFRGTRWFSGSTFIERTNHPRRGCSTKPLTYGSAVCFQQKVKACAYGLPTDHPCMFYGFVDFVPDILRQPSDTKKNPSNHCGHLIWILDFRRNPSIGLATKSRRFFTFYSKFCWKSFAQCHAKWLKENALLYQKVRFAFFHFDFLSIFRAIKWKFKKWPSLTAPYFCLRLRFFEHSDLPVEGEWSALHRRALDVFVHFHFRWFSGY